MNNLKKLLAIIVLGLLWSGNSYAEIIVLDCRSLMKETPEGMLYQTIKIDTKKKVVDTGLGYNSPIIEEDDKFFKAKHYGLDSETVYIDHYTGVIKILTTYKINGNKKISLFEHLKCERVEKKF